MNPNDANEAVEVLTSILKITSLPVAVKFIDDPAALDVWPPVGFLNPSTMGHKMAYCQVVSSVRKTGSQFALAAKDIMCGAALLAFGWVEDGSDQKEDAVKFFLDAKYSKDEETARVQISNMPLLSGELKCPSKGLLVAPLNSGAIEDPDVVLIYGNSAQIARLSQSVIYMTGTPIKSESKGGLSCTSEMIAPMLTGEPSFVVPGRGERSMGMAGNDELCFTVPGAQLGDLITGVKSTHAAGSKYPSPQFLLFEPKMPPTQSAYAEKIMAQIPDD